MHQGRCFFYRGPGCPVFPGLYKLSSSNTRLYSMIGGETWRGGEGGEHMSPSKAGRGSAGREVV